MKNQPKHTKIYLLLIVLVWFPLWSNGQTSQEQITRLQRAIFIYNLSEQVIWPNEKEFNTFNIGVLGKDRTVIDLKSLSQKRSIKNKSVVVKPFNRVRDVEGVNVLYVNKDYNFDMSYILKSIANRKILLISENYNYNTSMINMVPVGSSFEYEINEGVNIPPSFRQVLS